MFPPSPEHKPGELHNQSSARRGVQMYINDFKVTYVIAPHSARDGETSANQNIIE